MSRRTRTTVAPPVEPRPALPAVDRTQLIAHGRWLASGTTPPPPPAPAPPGPRRRPR